ncbi:hypothetical protein M9H77_14216 [Catharanthus roseus]|uniref:Uncharacterized protein n=1 Tax=Catharanthus roseus TaxID=4058 RepID=A0ACC0BMD8_CATRO|nr:hypothetical protein M9H77_14216 [Catharanthus roseus]
MSITSLKGLRVHILLSPAMPRCGSSLKASARCLVFTRFSTTPTGDLYPRRSLQPPATAGFSGSFLIDPCSFDASTQLFSRHSVLYLPGSPRLPPVVFIRGGAQNFKEKLVSKITETIKEKPRPYPSRRVRSSGDAEEVRTDNGTEHRRVIEAMSRHQQLRPTVRRALVSQEDKNKKGGRRATDGHDGTTEKANRQEEERGKAMPHKLVSQEAEKEILYSGPKTPWTGGVSLARPGIS